MGCRGGSCLPPPQKNGEKYFWGKYHVNFRHFSGKYYVKFRHFVNSSYIYFQAKIGFVRQCWLSCYTCALTRCKLCIGRGWWDAGWCNRVAVQRLLRVLRPRLQVAHQSIQHGEPEHDGLHRQDKDASLWESTNAASRPRCPDARWVNVHLASAVHYEHFEFLSLKPETMCFARLHPRLYVSVISPVSLDGVLPNFCHWCILGQRWTD